MTARDWLAPVGLADDLVKAGERAQAAETALAEAQQERRAHVLRALDAGMSPTTIAELAGLSRNAIYKIRDST